MSKLFYTLLPILWWVGIWGLIDILMRPWTVGQRLIAYLTIIVIVSVLIAQNPDLTEHF